MSRFFTDTDTEQVSNYLSEERLSTYLKLTRTLEDAIELHQATMSVGVAISAVTGLIEIGLRNASCHELSRDFGQTDWFRHPPTGLKWASLEREAIQKAQKNAQRAAYSKLTGPKKVALDGKAFPTGVPKNIKRRKLVEKRQATLSVSDGQVIAQLTLHFWKRLFSEHYEKTLWDRSLKKVFPNKTLGRPKVAEKLEVLYQTRNRLAHHEPVYGKRLDEVLEAIDFVLDNIGSKRPSSEAPLAKLVLPQRELMIGQVAMFRAAYVRLGA